MKLYRKWSNKRQGRLLNFKGPKGAFTVNPGHAWTVFSKFERSFEIYMSVLNIANEISEFPHKFP